MSQSPHSQDESLRQLEEELRALVPSAPSGGLRDRIFAALQDPVPTEIRELPASPSDLQPAGRGWFGWVPLAAAAAVAMLAVVVFPGPKGGHELVTGSSSIEAPMPQTSDPVSVNADQVSPVSWKPVSADSRLEHLGYDGLRSDAQATYRQIRTRSLERRTFIDPTDGTTVEVVFPRENIHLVPVVPE